MEKTILKDKKGQIGDMLFILVVIVTLGITILIAGYIYYQIQPVINSAEIATNESVTAFNAFSVAFPMLDTAFFFLTIALIVGLVITSLFITSHPIFMIVNIVGFIALVFLGAVFANVYGNILDQGTDTNLTMLDVAEANYPITNFILTKLPWFGAAIVLLSTIVMYSKSNEGYG